MGALTVIFSLLALASPGDELEARASALLEEHGPGYRVMETVAYRYVLPLDGERYVGEVMTPIEATFDRFFLDGAKLGWELARPRGKPEIVLFTDQRRWSEHLERRGYAPVDGYERVAGRVFLYDLGTAPALAGRSRKELLALNIAQATRAAARQLWYASGFLERAHEYPAWLEDGLAIALERDATHESASLFHDGRRPRLATLRAARERGLRLPLESWLDGNAGDLALDGLARPSLHEAQAWALVRFWLVSERETLPDYVAALERGEAPRAALEERLGPLAALEERYLERLLPAPR